jgi:hypothetical protein
MTEFHNNNVPFVGNRTSQPVIDYSTNYCETCSHQFSGKRSYGMHLKSIHNMKLVLSQRASQRLKAQPNISPIVDDPNNNCRSCRHQFASRQKYRNHLINVHKTKLEPIQKNKPKLTAQLNITPDAQDPNYNCRSCKHQFSSKQSYRNHVKNVHKMKLEPLSRFVAGDPNYNCQSCNHQYSSKHTYKHHLVTVHNMKIESLQSKPRPKAQPNIIPVIDDPNHTCRSCNHQYSSRQCYRNHLINIHKMKLEPLKRLPRYQIQPNISPIVDDPNNNCQSCNHQFSSKNAYRLHLIKLHKMKLEPSRKIMPQPNVSPDIDDPNNTCRSCTHQFSSKQAYRLHLENIHKIELDPLKTSKPKLTAKSNVSPVIDDPNNNCQSCNHTFSSKQGYRNHLMAIHKIELDPLVRQPRYKAQPNISPIVDDPNNNCRSCNRLFSSKPGYRWHLKKVHNMKLESLQRGKSKPRAQLDITPVIDDPNNTCRSCIHQFSSKQAYRNHLINRHKMKLEPLRPITSSVNIQNTERT